ncbi:hypothetical protein NQ318_013989, partial [Aromia moschata]
KALQKATIDYDKVTSLGDGNASSVLTIGPIYLAFILRLLPITLQPRNQDCPASFKCCRHRCFRHHICQPDNEVTKTTRVAPEYALSHPGECNIILSCGIHLPRSFTERFQCVHDEDCPEHYKCCYIECYHHKVCQPAKNEHIVHPPSLAATTAVQPMPPVVQTEKTKTTAWAMPTEPSTDTTTIETTLSVTSSSETYNTATDKVPAELFANAVTNDSHIVTTQPEITEISLSMIERESISTESLTISSRFDATTRSESTKNSDDEDYVEGSGEDGSIDVTTKILTNDTSINTVTMASSTSQKPPIVNTLSTSEDTTSKEYTTETAPKENPENFVEKNGEKIEKETEVTVKSSDKDIVPVPVTFSEEDLIFEEGDETNQLEVTVDNKSTLSLPTTTPKISTNNVNAITSPHTYTEVKSSTIIDNHDDDADENLFEGSGVTPQGTDPSKRKIDIKIVIYIIMVALRFDVIIILLCFIDGNFAKYYYKYINGNYDVYYGPRAHWGYKEIKPPKSLKEDFDNRGDRPGRCVNGDFPCEEPYEIEQTAPFECGMDYQCPRHFKCCQPKCFLHKVCQPAMLEEDEEFTINPDASTKKSTKISSATTVSTTTPPKKVTENKETTLPSTKTMRTTTFLTTAKPYFSSEATIPTTKPFTKIPETTRPITTATMASTINPHTESTEDKEITREITTSTTVPSIKTIRTTTFLTTTEPTISTETKIPTTKSSSKISETTKPIPTVTTVSTRSTPTETTGGKETTTEITTSTTVPSIKTIRTTKFLTTTEPTISTETTILTTKPSTKDSETTKPSVSTTNSHSTMTGYTTSLLTTQSPSIFSDTTFKITAKPSTKITEDKETTTEALTIKPPTKTTRSTIFPSTGDLTVSTIEPSTKNAESKETTSILKDTTTELTALPSTEGYTNIITSTSTPLTEITESTETLTVKPSAKTTEPTILLTTEKPSSKPTEIETLSTTQIISTTLTEKPFIETTVSVTSTVSTATPTTEIKQFTESSVAANNIEPVTFSTLALSTTMQPEEHRSTITDITSDDEDLTFSGDFELVTDDVTPYYKASKLTETTTVISSSLSTKPPTYFISSTEKQEKSATSTTRQISTTRKSDQVSTTAILALTNTTMSPSTKSESFLETSTVRITEEEINISENIETTTMYQSTLFIPTTVSKKTSSEIAANTSDDEDLVFSGDYEPSSKENEGVTNESTTKYTILGSSTSSVASVIASDKTTAVDIDFSTEISTLKTSNTKIQEQTSESPNTRIITSTSATKKEITDSHVATDDEVTHSGDGTNLVTNGVDTDDEDLIFSGDGIAYKNIDGETVMKGQFIETSATPEEIVSSTQFNGLTEVNLKNETSKEITSSKRAKGTTPYVSTPSKHAKQGPSTDVSEQDITKRSTAKPSQTSTTTTKNDISSTSVATSKTIFTTSFEDTDMSSYQTVEGKSITTSSPTSVTSTKSTTVNERITRSIEATSVSNAFENNIAIVNSLLGNLRKIPRTIEEGGNDNMDHYYNTFLGFVANVPTIVKNYNNRYIASPNIGHVQRENENVGTDKEQRAFDNDDDKFIPNDQEEPESETKDPFKNNVYLENDVSDISSSTELKNQGGKIGDQLKIVKPFYKLMALITENTNFTGDLLKLEKEKITGRVKISSEYLKTCAETKTSAIGTFFPVPQSAGSFLWDLYVKNH